MSVDAKYYRRGGRFTLSQITPLTYRDGETYVSLLWRLFTHIREELHPSLETAFDDVIDQLETQMDEAEQQYVDGIQEFQRIHDAFMEDVEASLKALNDTAVADLVDDEDSYLGKILRKIFVLQSSLDDDVADLIRDDTSATRTILDATYTKPQDIPDLVFENVTDRDSDTHKAIQEMIEDGVFTTPMMHGAIGDGVSDDTEALQKTLDDGRPIVFGNGVYRITDTITHSLQSVMHWYSQGAQIVVDSSTPLPWVFDVNLNGYDFTHHGVLTIDAQKNTYGGVNFENSGNDDVTLVAHNLTIRNVYRGGTVHRQGDGLNIIGGYQLVELNGLQLHEITMAKGAVVESPQLGIAGLHIRNIGDYYPRNVVLNNPVVSGVYSEDPELKTYQNGIRLFSKSTTNNNNKSPDTSFTVANGYFRNCRGRAIKTQAGFVSIYGTHIVRDVSHIQANSDIDIQMGNASITDVKLHHISQSARSPITLRVLGTPTNRRIGMTKLNGISLMNHTNQRSRSVVNVLHHTAVNSRFTISQCENVGNAPEYFSVISPPEGGTLNGSFDQCFVSPMNGFAIVSGNGSSATQDSRGAVAFSNIFNISNSRKPIVNVSNFHSPARWTGQFLFNNLQEWWTIPDRIDSNGKW